MIKRALISLILVSLLPAFAVADEPDTVTVLVSGNTLGRILETKG